MFLFAIMPIFRYNKFDVRKVRQNEKENIKRKSINKK